MSAVRAPYGPSLPELLGARLWRPLRAALAAGVLVALVVLALTRGGDEHVIVARQPVAFNFVFGAPLRRVGPAAIEQRRGAVFIQGMSAVALRLAPYRGDAGSTLPVAADRLAQRLARRHPGFRVVGEGRTRINDNPGYVLTWSARLGERRLFGRDYLLLPDEPGARDGARVELTGTYAAGLGSAEDVGRLGPLKRSLRSFRFGTERP